MLDQACSNVITVLIAVVLVAEAKQLGALPPKMRRELTQGLLPLTSDGAYELREMCTQLMKTLAADS